MDDGAATPRPASPRLVSAVLPPLCRRSPRVEVLPLLYLHGLSTKDFVLALEELFGASAGLSASAVTRLAKAFEEGLAAFMSRDLSGVGYVYCWVDGVHFNVRLEDARLCALVMVGVRADGRKELVGIADGYRERSDSWSAPLLHDCHGRGCGPRCCYKTAGIDLSVARRGCRCTRSSDSDTRDRRTRL
ncbi:MAG: transposase [Acidimicrobiaceae bacterium]|nr:transposase [Acidimicrobiaceae bacterium]